MHHPRTVEDLGVSLLVLQLDLAIRTMGKIAFYHPNGMNDSDYNSSNDLND